MKKYMLGATLTVVFVGCSGPWSGFTTLEEGYGYRLILDKNGGPEGDSMQYVMMDGWLGNSSDSLMEPVSGFNIEVFMRPSGDPYDMVQALRHFSIGDSGTIQWHARHFSRNPFFRKVSVKGMLPDSLVRLSVKIRNVLDAKGFAEKQANDKRRQMSAAVDAFKQYVQLYLPDRNDVDLAPIVITEVFPNKEALKPRYGDSLLLKYLLMDFGGKALDGVWGVDKPVWMVLGQGDYPSGFWEGLKQMRAGEKAMVVVPFTFAWGEMGAPEMGVLPFENLVYKIELVEVKAGPRPGLDAK